MSRILLFYFSSPWFVVSIHSFQPALLSLKGNTTESQRLLVILSPRNIWYLLANICRRPAGLRNEVVLTHNLVISHGSLILLKRCLTMVQMRLNAVYDSPLTFKHFHTIHFTAKAPSCILEPFSVCTQTKLQVA